MKLLFFPEFASNTGTGHFMRSYALAEYASQSGCQIVFILPNLCSYFSILLDGINAEVVPVETGTAWTKSGAELCRAIVEEKQCEWIVLDSYSLSVAFLSVVACSGSRIAILDDFGFQEFGCDLVVNQNSFAEKDLYDSECVSCLLLGCDYVLLRSEMRALVSWEREFVAPVSNLLISLGGSDPSNASGQILSVLQEEEFFGLNVVVIAGADNLYFSALSGMEKASAGRLQVVKAVDNMVTWMKWADVAIGAGGTSVWERCMAGLPSLTVKIADNQHRIVEDLSSRNCLINLGYFEPFDPVCFRDELREMILNFETRKNISKRSRELVDGLGCQRVFLKMQELTV